MENLKKVVALQDDSCHWYVIPMEMLGEFRYLEEGGEDTEEEFIEKFSQYMTGGDLNIIQLYAEI